MQYGNQFSDITIQLFYFPFKSYYVVWKPVWRLAKRKKLYFKGKNLKHGKIYVNNMLKKTN